MVNALWAPGASKRVFDAVFDGKLVPIYDARLFTEYRDMPGRPKFRGRIAADDVEFLIEQTRIFGEHFDGSMVRLRYPARDPKDTAVLELAVAGNVDAIVTGDKTGFPPNCYPFQYLPPFQILQMLPP